MKLLARFFVCLGCCLCCVSLEAVHAQSGPIKIAAPPKPDPTIPASAGDAYMFERINLGPNINTEYSELFPVITADETMMFFARKGDPHNVGYATNPNDEDIWYSLRRSDGSWSKAEQLPGPLNTDTYDGVRAVNNAVTRLYLQNIYRPDGTHAKGFSVSEKQADGSWSYPEALDIEDYYNDTTISMISISNDEKTMILALQRKGGKGAHDLYVSHNIEGLKWSKPELIDQLSTSGDELSPFISYDDRTVYFSTNGLGGLGLHDIFVSHRSDDTWQHWSTPRNLGAPINTPSFDAYFMLSAKGDTAYLSSPHESSTRGFGKSDIWKIGLKEWQRPGFVLPSGELVENVSDKDLEGSLLRLDNVLFDVGRANIKSESKLVLENVAKILIAHPALHIEVQGHTDADGKAERNLVLSQDRASSVRTFLIDHGVGGDRITAKGYGQTRPIAPNNTREGKALNRRVMILIKSADGSGGG